MVNISLSPKLPITFHYCQLRTYTGKPLLAKLELLALEALLIYKLDLLIELR